MGLMRKFFNQTRKPEGFLGKMMIKGMNSSHAKLADWGMARIPAMPVSEILEIGCGGGRNAAALLKKYPDAHLTAVDYSPLSVERTREFNRETIAAGRCTVQEGDVSNLALEEGKFDLAAAFETIYFWPGLERCFAEVAKVLKTGGCFVIVNESDGRDEASVKFGQMIDGMKTYTPEDIGRALRGAGFSEIRTERKTGRAWIAVIAKKG